MPNIVVFKSNGETLEVTTSTMFSMLADESSCLSVLGHLVRHGKLDVDLKTGPATLYRPSPSHPLPPITARHLTNFVVDGSISFALNVRMHIRATSPAEARNLCSDYLHGRERPPRDFSVEVLDDAQSFFNDVQIGNYQKVDNVEVTGVSPSCQYLLPPPAAEAAESASW